MYQIKTLNAFNDNYIWLLVNNQNQCVAVDPGDANPVLTAIKEQGLTLTDILVTHHHNDHIGGISALLQRFPEANVFGPATDRFPTVTHSCMPNEIINLRAGMTLQVMDLTGHTKDHIGFHDEHNAFVGDTMFSAGCGRLFEGSAEQMNLALQRIISLGQDMKLYCAHEYTLANLEFALAVEHDNNDLTQYFSDVKKLRENGKPSIPTTVAQQMKINPFLRANTTTIRQSIQQHFNLPELPNEQTSFRLLRQWKDNF